MIEIRYLDKNGNGDEKGNYFYPETIDDSKLIETKIEQQKK